MLLCAHFYEIKNTRGRSHGAPIYKVTFKGRYGAVERGVRTDSIRRAFHEGF